MIVTLMCEYQKAYGDDKYLKYAQDISNGILSMQRLEGRFNHVLNENFNFKEKDRVIYYEGEAVLALCKIYDLTKQEDYLNAAKKAIDYYILSNYESYADHWQEYAINEYSNYIEEKDVLEYGLKNAKMALENIKKNKQAYNTDIETLNNGIKMLSKHMFSGEIINENELKEALDSTKVDIINTFSSVKEQNKVEGFFIKKGYKSVRIDDVAHYILALCD